MFQNVLLFFRTDPECSRIYDPEDSRKSRKFYNVLEGFRIFNKVQESFKQLLYREKYTNKVTRITSFKSGTFWRWPFKLRPSPFLKILFKKKYGYNIWILSNKSYKIS